MIDHPQDSDAWKQARVGHVTASRISDVIARTKIGWGASRANYLAELVAERLTGAPAEQYTNAAMAWGTATEPAARTAYIFETDAILTEVGFIPHPTIAMSGASPDGFVGHDGLVEIKCPNTATHIETLRGAPIPDKYRVQMQWQMTCTNRLWCDYVSFDPRMPKNMQLFVKRITRDPDRIERLEKDVIIFLAELDEVIADLNARYGAPGTSGRDRLMEQLRASAT